MKYAERKATREKYGETTLAYTLIAHSRGRLHGHRHRVIYWDLPAEQQQAVKEGCGSKVIDWTLELQQRWLDKALAEWERRQKWLESFKKHQEAMKK